MAVHNTLRCPECQSLEDCYYPMGRLPACPDCGGERRVDWSHGQAPALFSDEKPALAFQPGDIADKRWADLAATRSGQQQMIAEVQAQYPGKRIVVEPPSHSRKVEVEERRQSIIDKRKEAGVDIKVVNEIKEEKRAKVREEGSRHREKKMRRSEVKEMTATVAARVAE